MKIISVLLLLLTVATARLSADGQGVRSREESVPPVIVLDGIVSSRQQWGPPGFGETPKVDQKVRVFVLKLRKPKAAKELSLDSGGRPGTRFAEIQLSCDTDAFPSCRQRLAESVGHHVTVSGELAYAANPSDFLPVGMTVRLIQRP